MVLLWQRILDVLEVLQTEILLEHQPYWSFDGEKITFDSERYRKDFRKDFNELLGIE